VIGADHISAGIYHSLISGIVAKEIEVARTVWLVPQQQ
jgi:hypothetical protein